MIFIPSGTVACRPGVRIGAVHAIETGEHPDGGIDIAPGTDGGEPCVVLWAGGDEPVIIPIGAIGTVMAALMEAALETTT